MDTTGRPIVVRWLGVAGLELRLEDQVLAVDPFFTRPPLWRMWPGRVESDHEMVADKMERCSFVLVSHAHWDHAMDVPDVAINTGAVVLGSAHTCRLMAACAVPQQNIRRITAGDRLQLGSFRVEVLPARHMRTPGFGPGRLPARLRPPLRLRDWRMDGCFSFRIEAGGLGLLDWRGVQPGPAPRADVLFVSCAQERAYYESLLDAVRPRLVVPSHWDDFLRPLTRPIRPSFNPPRWAWPPLRRVSLDRFRRMIESIAPAPRVYVPGVFQPWTPADLLPPAA